jgi:hypothetical protein
LHPDGAGRRRGKGEIAGNSRWARGGVE